MHAIVSDQWNMLRVYTVLPVSAPANKLTDVAEYLHRANYGLVLGNFELDFRDGEVRYKISADFQDNEIKLDHVNEMIQCALSTSDRYLPGVGAVIFAGQAPAAAVEAAEVD